MRRGFAIALVYIGLILIPVLIAAILVPPVVEQLNNLIHNLPSYVDDLRDFVEKNDTAPQAGAGLQHHRGAAEAGRVAAGRVGDAAGILSDIGLGLVNSVFAGVTILILSLFIVGSGRGWLDWLADRQGPEQGELDEAALRPHRERGRQLRGGRARAGADRRRARPTSCC